MAIRFALALDVTMDRYSAMEEYRSARLQNPCQVIATHDVALNFLRAATQG
jgi:hypothetical protein